MRDEIDERLKFLNEPTYEEILERRVARLQAAIDKAVQYLRGSKDESNQGCSDAGQKQA